jgi:hypothetical protein
MQANEAEQDFDLIYVQLEFSKGKSSPVWYEI